MTLKHLTSLRHFSTSRNLARPALSAEYKSSDAWDARFKCQMLNDTPRIKSINTKILNNNELDSLEVDVFINIAAPRTDEIAHLQEAAKILRTLRKSLSAHLLLPSTHHATCRLFLDSKKLTSLMTMLEHRVEFGIFPDSYALNLIFDEALEQGKLSFASRAAAMIMIQEEFGLNKISDRFALYSTAKYIESKTNFDDWIESDLENDPIFNASLQPDTSQTTTREVNQEESAGKKEEEEAEDDDEEDDAEYHRVPFLRNPYFDNHFDIKNPRIICGKTLSMLGAQLALEKSNNLSNKCLILGSILQGRWLEAKEAVDKSVQSNEAIDASMEELAHHYLTELHNVDKPDEQLKDSLLSSLKRLPVNSKSTISEQAESEFALVKDLEQQDINWITRMLDDWSKTRYNMLESMQKIEERKKLIEEIRLKKDELRRKEEFLYFYDKLRGKSLTRVDYN